MSEFIDALERYGIASQDFQEHRTTLAELTEMAARVVLVHARELEAAKREQARKDKASIDSVLIELAACTHNDYVCPEHVSAILRSVEEKPEPSNPTDDPKVNLEDL